MNKCFLDGDTENDFKGAYTGGELCWDENHSCEPHEHFDSEVICLHDGHNDHSHCPWNSFSLLVKSAINSMLEEGLIEYAQD